jgi:cyclase
MLQPRIIPCLLVSNKGLVKTVKFKEPRYIGDPINAVRIFNEKQTDELMILDIDATRLNKEPDYKSIQFWASECRMPLCYGGGVKTVEQAQKIFALGVEKIALSSEAVYNTNIISKLAERVGSQSVVVVLDVKKKTFGGYELFTHNGSKRTGLNPIDFAIKCIHEGAGEIVVNSIDMDGTMKGYDLDLIRKVRNVIDTPMTALGGAASLDDMGKLINEFGIIGASAGSLFVFRGKYKAVLINYPSLADKNSLIASNLNKQ